MTRLTNSWMRRVNFISVSEANSITSSANVSAYDIKIDGNRGHAAIRSQGSSRVFIGKVTDRTNGPLIDNRGVIQQGAGQYHACGVSKPSMGAVIWRVHWGLDAWEVITTNFPITSMTSLFGICIRKDRARQAVIRLLPVYSTGGVSALKVGSSFRPLLSVFMANR